VTFLGESDIAAMLADLAAAGGAVEVILGAAKTTGLDDRQAAEVFGGEMPGVISMDEGVHVQTGALPGLASGSAITVDGVARVVREATPYGDGAMTRIALRDP
jgi:hypothetical protein